MKRNTDTRASLDGNSMPQSKKRALSSEEAAARFRDGLFETAEQQKYTSEYAKSSPYLHGVIHPLIEPSLLRSVRDEIETQVSFTEKETDIYKIFQSGDLANLDGLDDSSLSKLPSLLKLRDAMYSARFREYLSSVTGSGKLSGQKTDMAINVYTEGCHLLCHDDVIGSRRLSYILYLTDPDTPWKPEWGGALRLFPTTTKKDSSGEDVKIPSPDYSLSIPPAFNQLSFFTVQPGESFHDVEEVYHPRDDEDKTQKRVRMAISGWFHIPQEGEDGYEEGLEEKLAERSSLAQLQGRGDIYDLPQPQVVSWEEPEVEGKGKAKVEEQTEGEFTESDLAFLLQYIAPSYLTPDIAEEMSDAFSAESSLSLERFLSDKFGSRVSAYIEEQERQPLPASADEIQAQRGWTVARPPHKHRYLYQHASGEKDSENPIQELLNVLFPSQAFRKWLGLVTGVDHLTSHNLLARRFRRGADYTLASAYAGAEPRLEFSLCLTPTPGWEKQEEEDEDEDEDEEEANGSSAEASKPKEKINDEAVEGPALGGYEIYMAGDDDEDEDEEEDPENANQYLGRKTKADPAIYRSAGADEDDGILFSTQAGWNRLSIVLRDSGTLKFVKYVSAAAKGDRWDITGEIGVEFDEDDEDGEDIDSGEEEESDDGNEDEA
ncbi:Prolyl 4-hydroxylase alpha subunit [Penicillium cf. griseofulvum]|uniref:uS12 prolyl 3,4-dihydroxylase n=1 Tax=Penicillium cf. griseofulvum TaxID=2972120 RepID=A0A9W9J3H6_9EURO|nr:Prolyl 4-hydroxylase alpha subunit [Penicillium cf. griseofulvum]KAJ5427557.1 Prolyl 4-hydroxylase alpha subunit [Penicillium cf. griseofulvum]KAJ5431755.1 Prolyl 4-hydroxylase alpha subunit [Penicillium cf. griseofulvum]